MPIGFHLEDVVTCDKFRNRKKFVLFSPFEIRLQVLRVLVVLLSAVLVGLLGVPLFEPVARQLLRRAELGGQRRHFAVLGVLHKSFIKRAHLN